MTPREKEARELLKEASEWIAEGEDFDRAMGWNRSADKDVGFVAKIRAFLASNPTEEPAQGERNEAIEAAAKVLDSYAEEMADEAVAQFANLAAADVRALSRPPSEATRSAWTMEEIEAAWGSLQLDSDIQQWAWPEFISSLRGSRK